MILLALATAAFDITYVAPRANEMTLVEAVERASVACGVEKMTPPRIAWVEAEPSDAAGKAALDEQTMVIMEQSGFGRDRANHAESFDAIRTLLKTRTFMRLRFTAQPNAQSCMAKWLADNKFTLLSPDQPLPDKLVN